MMAIEGEDRMPKEVVHAAPSFQDIAERGEAIYAEKYRAELEETSNGKFIAINVANADVTLADTGEDAIRLALEKAPSGYFHLIRVGHKAAFEAGWYMSCARESDVDLLSWRCDSSFDSARHRLICGTG
jgi:hypothetical protein